MELLLYAIALAMGISLGLLGAGGAIVSVPAMVYLYGAPPALASGYSLFVVTIASAIGSAAYIRERNVHWPSVLAFGSTTTVSLFCIRMFVLPHLPATVAAGNIVIARDTALMVCFAAVLFVAGVRMLRTTLATTILQSPHPVRLSGFGLIVGIIAGFLGVGGGFLMTPALTIWARLPIRMAVGTSLMLMAINSGVGVAADLAEGIHYEWGFVLTFTVLTSTGIVFGQWLSKRVKAEGLRNAFAWLVITLGVAVLIREFTR